jgi:hypothetical protein
MAYRVRSSPCQSFKNLLIEVINVSKIVCRHRQNTPAAMLFHNPPHHLSPLCVKIGHRLIQHEHGGIMHQRKSILHPLLHSRGISMDGIPPSRLQTHIPEQLIHAALVRGEAANRERHAQILFRRELVVHLKIGGDHPYGRQPVHRSGRVPLKTYVSRCRSQQPADYLNECGFPGPVAPRDEEGL